ncbi:UNVERIFIED_ORG: LacI family transcriptional regulator [Arthrobacter sp. UYCu721]
MCEDSPARTYAEPAGKISAASVARAANVSTATVSYVFNKRPGVSEETRQRVIEVATQLGYDASKVAASSDRRARIVGLVLSNIANPFYPELSVGFSEAARERGYQVFLCHTNDDQESLTSAIAAMVDRSVDGLAIAVARSDNASAVRQLRSARVPMVQISRKFPHINADFVGIDDRAAAATMMRHALQHQRWPLATVIGPRTSSASAAREEGFVSESQLAGVTIPVSHRISGPLTLEGGRAAAKHLFTQSNPPRFVLCGSDILALGVMSFALENGLRVPEDLAISGFDGISIMDTPMIDLTCIVQPRHEMSRQALEVLADLIERKRHSTTQLCVPHSLRIGRTCGCSTKGK